MATDSPPGEPLGVIEPFTWVKLKGRNPATLFTVCSSHDVPEAWERFCSSKAMPPRRLPPHYPPLVCHRCKRHLTR